MIHSILSSDWPTERPSLEPQSHDVSVAKYKTTLKMLCRLCLSPVFFCPNIPEKNWGVWVLSLQFTAHQDCQWDLCCTYTVAGTSLITTLYVTIACLSQKRFASSIALSPNFLLKGLVSFSLSQLRVWYVAEIVMSSDTSLTDDFGLYKYMAWLRTITLESLCCFNVMQLHASHHRTLNQLLMSCDTEQLIPPI